MPPCPTSSGPHNEAYRIPHSAGNPYKLAIRLEFALRMVLGAP